MLTSSYNPNSNSIVERINKTIGGVARIFKGKSPTKLKDAIEIGLNLTNDQNLKISPFEIIYYVNCSDLLKNKKEKYNQSLC